MDHYKFNADAARVLTQTSLDNFSEIEEEQFQRIIEKILAQATIGEFELYVDYVIYRKVAVKLRKMGYVVTLVAHNNYTVRWIDT